MQIAPTRPPDSNIASNRLHRGEVKDFAEAVATVKAAIANERAWHGGYQTSGQQGPDGIAWLADEELRADRALAIYASIMRTAEAAAVNELHHAGLHEWADALEAGDYRGLAI